MKGRAVLAAFVVAASAVAFLAATPADPATASSRMPPEFTFAGPDLDDPADAGTATAIGQDEPRPQDPAKPDEGDEDSDGPAGASWEPARTENYVVPVTGAMAEGLVGLPSEDPTTLLVLAHPYGVAADEYAEDLQLLAERGVLAVAMDFRGPRDAYKVAAGVEDTVAATLDLQEKFPTLDRTLLYGHSMGGEVALLAAASAPPGTFDYVFVGAGVTDLEALWHANVPMRPYIEQETGGPPTDVPDEYTVRSPIDRVADIAAQAMARIFLVYGSGDPAVPVDHAEKMYEGLSAAGVPVSYYVVTTDEDPLWCVPVAQVCPTTTPASHWAGRIDLMWPFIDHRIERMLDPAEAALRGTYDGDSGTYDPSDVG